LGQATNRPVFGTSSQSRRLRAGYPPGHRQPGQEAEHLERQTPCARI